MLRRRHATQESPAWPGLVDLFAFSLIIFVVISLADQSQSEPDNDTLEKQLDSTRIELAAVRDSLESVMFSFKEANRKITLLESDLKLYKKQSEEAERAAEDAKERLKARARILAKNLRDDLQEQLGGTWGDLEQVHPNLPEFELTEFQGKPIYFETGKWALSKDGVAALTKFRIALKNTLAQYPAAQIEVNGTADPQPFNGKWQIKDNIELSAMRAATVAKLLSNKNSDEESSIQNKILVVGLGETGKKLALGLSAQSQKSILQKFRTVTLKIRIPLDEL